MWALTPAAAYLLILLASRPSCPLQALSQASFGPPLGLVHARNSSVAPEDGHSGELFSRLDVGQLARARGFGLEAHRVLTRDKYILTAHRLVNPLVPRAKLGKVVIVQHGILCASSFFLLNSGPRDRPELSARPNATSTSNSLAIALANLGYDVWLTNFRGTEYSRDHLDPEQRLGRRPQYWDFNVDSLVEFDLEASVSHALAVRAREQPAAAHRLRYTFVGHSLGATVGLGALLVHADTPITQRLACAVLLAPVASTQYMEGGLLPLFQAAARLYADLAPFPGASDTFARFARRLCLVARRACTWLASQFVGAKQVAKLASSGPGASDSSEAARAEYQAQVDTFALMMRQAISVRMLKHIVQVHLSGRLSRFDFGPEENARRYGEREAPIYDLGAVRAPDLRLAIVSGPSDAISTPGEVQWIARQLEGNVAKLERIVVELNPFNHMDLIMSRDAGHLVNRKIVEFALANDC